MAACEHLRVKEEFKQSIASHVELTRGRSLDDAELPDTFYATARALRDRMIPRWIETKRQLVKDERKRIYYLSHEYLLGRLLEDGLLNLGILDEADHALQELKPALDILEVAAVEPDVGLGNGGLGRLAACFLDSMATLGLPAMGYGLRYEYGIFKQAIAEGRQVELADRWLQNGNPWEVPRTDRCYQIQFYGRVDSTTNAEGRTRFFWLDTTDVEAVAHDVLVPGYRNGVVNTLRLWSAQATEGLGQRYLTEGDYSRAIEERTASENLSRMLYPDDMPIQGRELRLKQEAFFVSATLQDALARHLRHYGSVRTLPEKAVFQLNDTHPALAVVELMRQLLDVHELEWEEAWSITRRCLAYTNHTVLPEALQTWPAWLLERVLPRHLQIAYEINARFLSEVRSNYPGDERRVQQVSLFDEVGEKRLRVAHLALVGAASVNGVSQLHGRMLREQVFPDFATLFPHKFRAITNGITPRRWLLKCNPSLAASVTSRIGSRWVTHLEDMERLTAYAEDSSFQEEWNRARAVNKARLTEALQKLFGITLDPTRLFDVQVKRIHEYKRHLLNVLHVLCLFLRYRDELPTDVPPRTFIFGGKAAPGYAIAKSIVRLIHDVAALVAADARVSQVLQVCYVPNYNVSLAELIIPAADVSEQLSLAGMEASGTGNMKFQLNGALTVGTLDGANIEILEAVGSDNIFTFGLSTGEVRGLKARGYHPRDVYGGDSELRRIVDLVANGTLCPQDPERYRALVETLLTVDRYLVLADFAAYKECHAAVVRAYQDRPGWTRKSILNTAKSGRFSSDTTIRNYVRDIWGLT